MSLTPKMYSSTDPGAPLLSGQPGALAILLDALLVDGYGSGADQKAGMGWSRAFSGTNVRVYRNSPLTGSGCYLRVDDTAQRSALLRMYATMSDIDVGTDATPTVAVKAIGCRWEKSMDATAGARQWFAVGTEKFFYLLVDTGNAFPTFGSQAMHPHYAGDITSLKPGDRHNFVLSFKGSDGEGSSAIGYALRAQPGWSSTPSADGTTCCFIGRNVTATPGSVRAYITAPGQPSVGGIGSSTSLPPYPYVANSGLLFSPVEVLEGAFQPRGFLPGIYAPLHRKPFPEMTVVSDVAGLPAGTKLLAKGYVMDTTGYNEGYSGQFLVDTTNEW